MSHPPTSNPSVQPSPSGGSGPDSAPVWGIAAEFGDVTSVVRAARRMKERGYRQWDVHSPFPIHGIDRAMGISPTVLPLIVFLGGLAGCLGGLFIAWWSNATSLPGVLVNLQGYQYLISGKPMFSLPANIPVVFETTVLGAALSAVFGMLLLNKLPTLHHPLLHLPRFKRVTDDRFFITVKSSDPNYHRARLETELRELGASTVEDVPY